MKVSILCSSANHPINKILKNWISLNSKEHTIELCRNKVELSGGDLLFLITCHEIITEKDRSKYLKSLVIHASDLPKGRGWSPHVWQILEGSTSIVVSLLEAEDKVDTGDIWHKVVCRVSKDMLFNEINNVIFDAEVELMDFAITNFSTVEPFPQEGEASYYEKRTPSDSRIDPNQSIAAQFDLIRVCDSDRFPAFFELHGKKYFITLNKGENNE